jgi:hypothetical protein
MAVSDSPTDLGSLLASALHQKNWQRRLRLHQVFLFWDEVVGGEIARHAQPRVIRGGVLWLAVSDSIWMQQLQFERHQLLELLNARLSEGEGPARSAGAAEGAPLCLTDLKFQLDPSLRRRKKEGRPAKPVGQAIDHDRFAQFSESLNSIADPETRECMKRLWLAMHRGAAT